MIHIDIPPGRIEGTAHRFTGTRTGQSNPCWRKAGGWGWDDLHLAADAPARLLRRIFPTRGANPA